MVMDLMTLAQSKVTAQGQISVPAEVRRRLGLGPGSVLEWVDDSGQVIIRRAGRYSSADVSRALFPSGPPHSRSIQDFKEGIRKSVRERHARH
jgi:AbrB family looped-hinge helix DNA binding protein